MIIIYKIQSVRRLSNKFAFGVTFTDGTAGVTKPGSQVNYIIENSDMHGVPLRVFFEGGQIARVEKV
jgi:hypothetical protein